MKLVFFAIFLPVLSAAVSARGILALQQPLAAFMALIPKILVAIVLVVIGAVLPVAGVIIVGVGGGLIQPMQNRWESELTRPDQEKDKIKAQQSPSADSHPADPYAPSATTAAPAPLTDARTATYGTPCR